MSETPPEFDLRFLPDWLKQGPSEQRYADYEGEPENRGRRGDRGDRGPRRDQRGPGGPGGARGPGGPRPQRGDSRGPRSGGPGGPGGPRREGGRDRRDQRQGDFRRSAPPPPPPPPAAVKVEFLPEPSGAAGIAKQIKQSGRAYPLFGTGRLFLERPERHRVRISSQDPNVPLYQIGDGPVSFDRATVERNAFRFSRDQYYKEEVIQGEPLKGNFTNVARSRTTGALLGPTSYHAYQPTIRRLYEERFARRMSFPEFVQKEIEIVSDEQTVNEWKEQARSSTTYTTTQEAEPLTFKSAFDAEQHFKKQYLPQMLKSGTTLECSGVASRSLPDRSIGAAVREAWEKERAFPAQLVNNLRPYLLDSGLHFFKHRKRVLFISAVRPVRHQTGQVLSAGVAKILSVIEGSPKCTRRELAQKVLGENHDAPEAVEQKAALARDLHYLVHTGHVIEFHDGTLDLPLIPGGNQGPQGQGGQKQQGGSGKSAQSAKESVEAEEEDADIAAEEPSEAPAAESASLLAAAPTEPVAVEGQIEPPAATSGDFTASESLHASAEAPQVAPLSETTGAENSSAAVGELAASTPVENLAPAETINLTAEAPVAQTQSLETSEPSADAALPMSESLAEEASVERLAETESITAEISAPVTAPIEELKAQTDASGAAS